MDTKAEWHDNVRTDEINDNGDQSGTGQLDPTGVLVKPKWRGTSQDKTDMEILGRHQVLRVSRTVVPCARPSHSSRM